MSYKRIATVGAVIASSTLVWWLAKVWLDKPEPFVSWFVMLLPALATVLFGAVSGLAMIVLDRWPERIAALLGSWASFVIFWSGDIYYLSALPVFALFWWMAYSYIHNDLVDRRQVRVLITLTHGMKFILFAAFLMVSLGFYFTPHAQEASITGISNSIQMQLKQGLTVNIDQVIRTLLKPIAQWIPPLFALGLFLVLWSINFIFREPAVYLGSGLFWILRKTGFVRIEKKQIETEVIAL